MSRRRPRPPSASAATLAAAWPPTARRHRDPRAYEALHSLGTRPRTRYLVGTDAKIRARVAKVMPDRMMDRAIARQLK